MTYFLKKIRRFLKELIGIDTMKDKVDKIKRATIDKFKSQLIDESIRINTNQMSLHPLKDCIETDQITEDKNRIMFNFLEHNFVLNYRINPSSKTISVIVEAFENVLNHNNYPNYILIPVPELKFSFSANENKSGFKDYVFDGNIYCIGNKYSDFFAAYFKKITDKYFPQD
jgi:hypothetical protein